MAAKAKKKKVVKATAAKKTVAKKQAVKKAKPVKKAAKPVKAAKKAAPAKKTAAKAKAKPVATKSAVTIKWNNFLTPLDDRLIVEAASTEKMTAGGLYIPDTVSDTSGNFKGKVLVAGRGHRDKFGKVKPMDVKAGDTVLFAEHSGSTMDLNGTQVRILRESEILGIIS